MNESRTPSDDQIVAALAKLLGSAGFRASERRSRFLKYIVAEKLAGRADQIKGYSIGIDVFEKKADFDPQVDPIVRLEASRLRRDLEHYYLAEGACEEIRFAVPKGSYVPSIEIAPAQASPASPETTEAAEEVNTTQADDGQIRDGRFNRGRGFRRLDYRMTGAAAVVALVLVGAWQVFGSTPHAERSPNNLYGPTIYIAPFEAVAPSAGPLARGITTEMVSVLSQFVELRVYPVTANFVGPTPGSGKIQNQQSGFRLTGSVQVVGEDLRVTARLQDTSDGLQVWTERYDADYSPHNVFEIQDGIATDVAQKLAEPYGMLREFSRERLSERHDPSLAAYKCVLLGYQYRQRFSVDLHKSARSCLEQTIRTDPEYARAWALLAYIYADEYRAFYNTLPNARGRSLAAAQRAVELSPDDVLSYQALSIAHFINGQTDAALVAAKQAVKMNRYNNEALFQLGMRTAFAGDWDEGFKLAQRAIEESPTAPTWYQFLLALYHYAKGDYENARIAVERVRPSDVALIEAGRAMIYGQLDMQEQAERALNNCRRLDPQFDSRAREWFAVHQIDDDILDRFMEGLYKAGLPRSEA